MYSPINLHQFLYNRLNLSFEVSRKRPEDRTSTQIQDQNQTVN